MVLLHNPFLLPPRTKWYIWYYFIRWCAMFFSLLFLHSMLSLFLQYFSLFWVFVHLLFWTAWSVHRSATIFTIFIVSKTNYRVPTQMFWNLYYYDFQYSYWTHLCDNNRIKCLDEGFTRTLFINTFNCNSAQISTTFLDGEMHFPSHLLFRKLTLGFVTISTLSFSERGNLLYSQWHRCCKDPSFITVSSSRRQIE